MKLSILATLTLLVFTSCNELDCNACKSCKNLTEVQNGSARVMHDGNLYVFVLSEPVKEYQVLAVINNQWVQELAQAGDNKKLSNILMDFFQSASQNVRMEDIIDKMKSAARLKYPNAEGLVFSNNLMEAKVIQFVE